MQPATHRPSSSAPSCASCRCSPSWPRPRPSCPNDRPRWCRSTTPPATPPDCPPPRNLGVVLRVPLRWWRRGGVRRGCARVRSSCSRDSPRAGRTGPLRHRRRLPSTTPAAVAPRTPTRRRGSSPSGQLRAVSFSAYSWSDDGGETWRHLALRLGGDLPELVPTASDRVHAVLLGGDGATLFPWTRILESTDGAAWTSYDGPEDPIAYVDSPAVLPDGRLLINVEVWSDQRAGRPAARPVGTYVGRDWSCPHAVDMGAPFGTSPRPAVLNVLDVAVTTRSVTL